MRVIIDPALFAPQSPFDFEMIRLLSAAVDRPHQVLVDGGDAGERLRDDWLAQRDRALLPPFKRLFEQAFGASFTRHPPSVTLDVTTRRPEQVHGEHRATAGPARASGLVTAPLGVLLENAVNDAAFLQLVTPPGPLRRGSMAPSLAAGSGSFTAAAGIWRSSSGGSIPGSACGRGPCATPRAGIPRSNMVR